MDHETLRQRRRVAVAARIPAAAVRPVGRPTPLGPSAATSQPDAEAALRSLKQRLRHDDRPKDAVTAAVRRASRRQGAATIATASPQQPDAAAVSLDACDAARRDVAFDDLRDPRCDEPWFQRLPLPEQQRLVQRWREQSCRHAELPALRRRESWRCALLSALAMVPIGLLAWLAGARLFHLPWLCLFGAIAGAVGARLAFEVMGFALLGLLAFAVEMTGAMLQAPLLFYVWQASASAMGLVGLDRQSRQGGGWMFLRRNKAPQQPA
jgi:hypothetical protein